MRLLKILVDLGKPPEEVSFYVDICCAELPFVLQKPHSLLRMLMYLPLIFFSMLGKYLGYLVSFCY